MLRVKDRRREEASLQIVGYSMGLKKPDTFTLKSRRGNLASEMRDASISAQRNAGEADPLKSRGSFTRREKLRYFTRLMEKVLSRRDAGRTIDIRTRR